MNNNMTEVVFSQTVIKLEKILSLVDAADYGRLREEVINLQKDILNYGSGNTKSSK
tara:strand:- start:31 stop:198 length:168 start_codon:yes stop_codon:yes gene_type:complete